MKKASAWAFVSLLSLLVFSAPARASTSAETLLAIAINGEQVSVGSMLLYERDGSYAIASEDAQAWRLILPTQVREEYQGHSYIPLRLIPAIGVHLNEQLQRLELRIPAKYFQTSRINESSQVGISPERGKGAFLSYDVRQHDSGGEPALLNAVLDTGATLGHGVLDTSYVGDAGKNVTSLRRISSSWQEDDARQHKTLRIGDSSTDNGALIVGQPFFGVQLVSNFTTIPNMSLYPRPTIAGSTDGPATADVYVDGRLVVRQDLPSGPFQLQDIPTPGDVGNVQVIVKDASGREQVIATPYYGPNTLLKGGLTTFSWGAGFEGTTDDGGTERYGSPVAEVFDQHGFNDRFTGEFDSMLARDGRAVSGGGVWLIPRVGTLDLALSSAAGTGIGGSRFDYEYLSRRLRFGFGASTMLQDNTNTLILTPGISAPSQTTRQTQAHLSYQTSAHSAVTVTLTNQNQNTIQNAIDTSSQTRTLQAGYFTTMGSTQLNFTLFRDTGSVATNAYSLSALIPLDFRHRAIVSAATQGGRDASNIVLTADPLLSGDHDDLGYSLTLGSSDSGLQVTDWTPFVDLQASYTRIADIDESQLEARGSIVSIGDRFYTSRYILQSYGLAQVPDHPHVRVYADGQYVGTTDKQGNVLLPNLQPYQNNAVSLESKDFPVTANVDTFKKNAVPYYHSPVKVRFPVRSDGGVVVHIKMPDGSFLPSGATVSADGYSWPVLDQGSAYLEGVHPGSLTLSAEAGETHCLVALTIPKNLTDIPDIGETVCRANP